MNTIVRDKVLAPYHCSRDNHGWTIFEEIESKESNKVYTKAVCHPSSFGRCLKIIAELKTHKDGEFNSIKEYLNQYTTEHNKISKEFKNVNI